MSLFQNLTNRKVQIAEGPIAAACAPVWPEEEPAIANAVPSRKEEFAAGRSFARQAMASLGVTEVPLPAGPDRVPIWPKGIVGSITHTATYAAAAAGRVLDGIVAVGIDLEPIGDLDREIWPVVLTQAEQDWVRRHPSEDHGLLAKLHFSAKESAFKCQFTLSKQMLEFEDFEIALDMEHKRFTAGFVRDCRQFRAGFVLNGAFCTQSGLIATAMALGDDVLAELAM
ncbi:MAG: 4'-phosphopantetheinyl transferase family protein [Hyphomicrobiaceae bacterium]